MMGRMMNGNNTPRPNCGCKGDPRMNRAVHLRLNNPNLSLVDALIAGGFAFPEGIKRQNRKKGKIYDSDGVSLDQRRNQLSKRLWQATKKYGIEMQSMMHQQEQALLEGSNLLASTKDIRGNVGSSCGIDNIAGSVQNRALNDKKSTSNKKSHEEDNIASFSKLMDFLFEEPVEILSNESLTLDELIHSKNTNNA
uniref:Uncharacterized protein n=1 Tax=Ditylum brightwellii TaxID=49249 RepID=A0A7S1ZCV9_9STRA|mmetsp:Transcript_26735/g.35612  ORF Transcript_26735/g.35612 Transcript_26735/m.35612 type:complete len:195 (+) Transcript_26735:24-608(+)